MGKGGGEGVGLMLSVLRMEEKNREEEKDSVSLMSSPSLTFFITQQLSSTFT